MAVPSNEVLLARGFQEVPSRERIKQRYRRLLVDDELATPLLQLLHEEDSRIFIEICICAVEQAMHKEFAAVVLTIRYVILIISGRERGKINRKIENEKKNERRTIRTKSFSLRSSGRSVYIPPGWHDVRAVVPWMI